MDDDLVRSIQRYVAVSSISASAVRGRTRGVLHAARDFAATMDLGRFATVSPVRFRRSLDAATEALRISLPRGGQSWGVARKALNLFLRDALYNHYLRQAYRLERSEPWYEVPLDAMVARAVLTRLPHANLPRWTTIKALSRAASDAYQNALAELAGHRGIARVHLDAILWLEGARTWARRQ